MTRPTTPLQELQAVIARLEGAPQAVPASEPMPTVTIRGNPRATARTSPFTNQILWRGANDIQEVATTDLTNDFFEQELDNLSLFDAGRAEAPILKKTPMKEKPNIQEQYGIKPNKDVVKLFEQHHGEQIMGVELEIENFPVTLEEAKAVGIDFVSDGSLRNNGVEAVTRPNHPKALLTIIKNLWDKYSISDKNFSDRTSIHVHCNVLHFNDKQIKTLVVLYSLVEEILFEFVGNDRRENIFCVPWCEAGVHVGNYNRVWTHSSRWYKYTALNLLSIATQGTVEFRHMYGHADHEKLADWLFILKDLMASAEKMDSEAIYKRVMDLNTTSEYMELLKVIFPNTSEILFTRSPNWQQHIVRGVIEAKLSAI